MQLPRRQTLVRILIVFTRENKLICLFVVITGAGSKGRCSLSCRFPLADLLTCTKCSGRHHHVCDGETISLNICKKCSGIETTISTHETPHTSTTQKHLAPDVQTYTLEQVKNKSYNFDMYAVFHADQMSSTKAPKPPNTRQPKPRASKEKDRGKPKSKK